MYLNIIVSDNSVFISGPLLKNTLKFTVYINPGCVVLPKAGV